MTPPIPPQNRRPYQKHGLYSLKRALGAVSGQEGWLESLGDVGEALKVWRADLVADLGGEGAISTQERAVIELATRTQLLLESIDRWLLEQPSLVNKSRRQLFPVVLQRQQLADALARYMAQLGLKSRTKPVPALGGCATPHRGFGPHGEGYAAMLQAVVAKIEAGPPRGPVRLPDDPRGPLTPAAQRPTASESVGNSGDADSSTGEANARDETDVRQAPPPSGRGNTAMGAGHRSPSNGERGRAMEGPRRAELDANDERPGAVRLG